MACNYLLTAQVNFGAKYLSISGWIFSTCTGTTQVKANNIDVRIVHGNAHVPEASANGRDDNIC